MSNVVVHDAYVHLGSTPWGTLDDLLSVWNTTATNFTVVGTERGQAIHCFGSSVSGTTRIQTGAGNDMVSVYGDNFAGFGGAVDIKTDTGNDLVRIQGLTRFESDVEIRLGAGGDVLHFDFDPAEHVLDGDPYPPRFLANLTFWGQVERTWFFGSMTP